MGDVGGEFGEVEGEIAASAEVEPGVDCAAEFGDFDVAVSGGFGALDEASFGTGGGSGEECDLVAAGVQAFAGEQRVFLGATDDEPGDDVGDMHGGIMGWYARRRTHGALECVG